MEPASLLIDEAADLAIEGKSQDAIEKYREALAELDKIEKENQERAKSTEFATVRNKRAYVNAAIDSLLMSQVQQNAKAVAVSDTTELEKRFIAEKEKAAREEKGKAEGKNSTNDVAKAEAKAKTSKGAAKTPREQALRDIEAGDYDAAALVVESMLIEKPNSAAALNMKARIASARGNWSEAEAVLDQAIMSNPRSYHAYYNMARLMLSKEPPNRTGARRYYETGRAVGGPEDPELEAKFK